MKHHVNDRQSYNRDEIYLRDIYYSEKANWALSY
jgi:hypothetical protein